MTMEGKILLNPKQKRSIATKSKIKKVARQLFAEQGYYAVTSNKIAAAASIPIGSFYNYFGNKKGVLLELIQDFNEEFHKETIQNAPELIAKITSVEMAKEHLTRLFRRAILSSHLADPFYSMIHALQFTEPDVLVLSEKIRQIEINAISRFLEIIHPYASISNIPIIAKILHLSSENVALYIHHLGTKHERELLIEKTLVMFFGLLFGKLSM